MNQYRNDFIIRESKENMLHLNRGVIEGNHLYSCFCSFPAICSVDMSSGEGKIFLPDLEESDYGKSLHLVAEKIGSQLVLIPHHSSDLVFFDLETGTETRYPCGGEGPVHYNKAYLYKKKLFLLPVFRRDIGIFDLSSQTLSFYEISWEETEVEFHEDLRFAVTSSCMAKNRIFLLCSNPDVVIEFDCDNYTLQYHTDMTGYMSMCFDGTAFWIGRRDQSIIKCDQISLKPLFMPGMPKDFTAAELLPLSTSVAVNGMVIFLSFSANMILRVNTGTNEIDRLQLPETSDHSVSETRNYTILGTDDRYLYLFWRRQTAMIRSDVAANTYQVIPLHVRKEEIGRLHRLKTAGKELDYSLESFIRYISCISQVKQEKQAGHDKEETIGEMIYELVTQEKQHGRT